MLKDLTGERFGKLLVIGRSNDDYVRPNGSKTTKWDCLCDCGRRVSLRGDHMKTGNTLSCGFCSHNTFEFKNDICIVYDKNKKSFIIDIDDYDLIKNRSWSFDRHGYVVTCDTNEKNIKLHRYIMNVNDPKTVIDHIDHNPANNRKSNLRICSQQQNALNQKPSKRNKSGYVGVSFDKKFNKWLAQIGFQGKNYYLGRYNKIEDAITARHKAELNYFKEFCYDNTK